MYIHHRQDRKESLGHPSDRFLVLLLVCLVPRCKSRHLPKSGAIHTEQTLPSLSIVVHVHVDQKNRAAAIEIFLFLFLLLFACLGVGSVSQEGAQQSDRS